EAPAAFREAARGRTQAAAWTYLGDVAARRGDLTEALSWWRLALPLGDPAPLLHRIGWAQMRRGHFREAEEALAAAWKAGDRPCLAALGLAAAHAHEAPDKALGWLREPCREVPWADLWTWWPALSLQALDRAGLEAALTEAVASDNPVPRAVVLGKAFTALGLPSLAEREWLTVVAHRPQWGTAWAYLGHARARLGKPALEDLQRAVFLEPQSEQTWYFLGRWWAANGVPQVAAEAFRNGLRAHPDNLALTLELAFALAAARDYQGAGEMLDRAASLAEEQPSTFYRAVARFYLERLVQVHERGLPAAARFLEEAPSSAEAHELMGWAAWLIGDTARAEAELSRAVEMAPLSASAWYHRAAMLAATGRAMAAREAYMRAVVLDPLGFYGAR
ncbi:MAG: tetratricopeptide repeat protein, partial [Anaerolineae bacterium]|nr:tetratricopeptide repeat protein [Anaerolineae bacterium]